MNSKNYNNFVDDVTDICKEFNLYPGLIIICARFIHKNDFQDVMKEYQIKYKLPIEDRSRELAYICCIFFNDYIEDESIIGIKTFLNTIDSSKLKAFVISLYHKVLSVFFDIPRRDFHSFIDLFPSDYFTNAKYLKYSVPKDELLFFEPFPIYDLLNELVKNSNFDKYWLSAMECNSLVIIAAIILRVRNYIPPPVEF